MHNPITAFHNLPPTHVAGFGGHKLVRGHVGKHLRGIYQRTVSCLIALRGCLLVKVDDGFFTDIRNVFLVPEFVLVKKIVLTVITFDETIPLLWQVCFYCSFHSWSSLTSNYPLPICCSNACRISPIT